MERLGNIMPFFAIIMKMFVGSWRALQASQFLSVFKVASENILILVGSSCSELFGKTLLLKKTFQKLILCCFEGFNAYFHNTVSAFLFRND